MGSKTHNLPHARPVEASKLYDKLYYSFKKTSFCLEEKPSNSESVNLSLLVSDLKNLRTAFKHIPMNILGSSTLSTGPQFVPISP